MTRGFAIAAAALALVAACEAKKGQPSGIGKWRVGGAHPTVRADAKDGICTQDKTSTGRPVTWCHTLPPIKVGNRAATVDLYFDGHGDDGALIEIQLGIRGCVEDELDRWIRAALGAPIETRATRAYWKNDFLWLAALMPSEPGRCLVHVLPLSETAEIERIKNR